MLIAKLQKRLAPTKKTKKITRLVFRLQARVVSIHLLSIANALKLFIKPYQSLLLKIETLDRRRNLLLRSTKYRSWAK